MSRKVLFRGKRIDNGEWVYGFPISYHANLNVEGIETWDGERHPVYESTVGQYTGIKDRNGTMIFEGDFVAICYGTGTPRAVCFEDGAFTMNGSNVPARYLNRFCVVGSVHDAHMGR